MIINSYRGASNKGFKIYVSVTRIQLTVDFFTDLSVVDAFDRDAYAHQFSLSLFSLVLQFLKDVVCFIALLARRHIMTLRQPEISPIPCRKEKLRKLDKPVCLSD